MPKLNNTKRTTDEDVAIGQRIRALRIARQLSQTDLATQLGVTFQQVQKYEKGVNRVGGGRLMRIAGIFNVPITDIMRNGVKKAGDADPFALMSQTRQGLRLATAFNQLENTATRDMLVTLAETAVGLTTAR